MSNATDITGDKGELLTSLIVSHIAFVEKYSHDKGLDFYCRLRTKEECKFYIQSKASDKPTYKGDHILSLPVEISTIYKWLKESQPVFLFMTDARRNKLFFLRITRELIENELKISDNQKTISINIPLKNCIDENNVGQLLLPEVIENSDLRETPLEELNEWFENYKSAFPLLFHHSNEINNYLELLRSPDQSKQIKARNLIRIRYSEHEEEHTINILTPKDGEIFNEFENMITIRNYSSADKLPNELIKGIIEVFRNTSNRITQHHVLDIITLFQIKEAETEIVKCIQRNLNLFEFSQTHVGFKHTFLDFLFDGLAELKSEKVYPAIRELIKHQTTYLLLPIIRFAKALKIKKAKEDLIPMMSFGIDSEGYNLVRKEACKALFEIGLSKTDFRKILKEYGKNELYDASVIYLYALCEDDKFSKDLFTVSKKTTTNSLKISILFYIKELGLSHINKNIIIKYFLDENQTISNEAHHIIHFEKDFLTENDKVNIALELINKGYRTENNTFLMKGLELMFTRHNAENAEKLIDIFLLFLENKSYIIEEKMMRVFGIIANYKSERLLETLTKQNIDFISEHISIVIYLNEYLPEVITFEVLNNTFQKCHYSASKKIKELLLEKFKNEIPNYVKTKLSNPKSFDFVYKAAELVDFPLQDIEMKSLFIQNLQLIVKNHYYQSGYRNNRDFLRFLFDKFPNESADLIIQDLQNNQIDNIENFNYKVRILGKVSSENCKVALLNLLNNQYLENYYGLIIQNLIIFKNDHDVSKRVKSLEHHHSETIRNAVKAFYK